MSLEVIPVANCGRCGKGVRCVELRAGAGVVWLCAVCLHTGLQKLRILDVAPFRWPEEAPRRRRQVEFDFDAALKNSSLYRAARKKR